MGKPITILMAEDDPEDRMLVEEAWELSRVSNELRFVEDGEELMDYLRRRGKYSAPASSPRPGLILLDLNMPKKDGREALEDINPDHCDDWLKSRRGCGSVLRVGGQLIRPEASNI